MRRPHPCCCCPHPHRLRRLAALEALLLAAQARLGAGFPILNSIFFYDWKLLFRQTGLPLSDAQVRPLFHLSTWTAAGHSHPRARAAAPHPCVLPAAVAAADRACH